MLLQLLLNATGAESCPALQPTGADECCRGESDLSLTSSSLRCSLLFLLQPAAKSAASPVKPAAPAPKKPKPVKVRAGLNASVVTLGSGRLLWRWRQGRAVQGKAGLHEGQAIEPAAAPVLDPTCLQHRCCPSPRLPLSPAPALHAAPCALNGPSQEGCQEGSKRQGHAAVCGTVRQLDCKEKVRQLSEALANAQTANTWADPTRPGPPPLRSHTPAFQGPLSGAGANSRPSTGPPAPSASQGILIHTGGGSLFRFSCICVNSKSREETERCSVVWRTVAAVAAAAAIALGGKGQRRGPGLASVVGQ